MVRRAATRWRTAAHDRAGVPECAARARRRHRRDAARSQRAQRRGRRRSPSTAGPGALYGEDARAHGAVGAHGRVRRQPTCSARCGAAARTPRRRRSAPARRRPSARPPQDDRARAAAADRRAARVETAHSDDAKHALAEADRRITCCATACRAAGGRLHGTMRQRRALPAARRRPRRRAHAPPAPHGGRPPNMRVGSTSAVPGVAASPRRRSSRALARASPREKFSSHRRREAGESELCRLHGERPAYCNERRRRDVPATAIIDRDDQRGAGAPAPAARRRFAVSHRLRQRLHRRRRRRPARPTPGGRPAHRSRGEFDSAFYALCGVCHMSLR